MAGEHDQPRPYRPKDGVTLVGPFWTRRQVAAFLGLTSAEVRLRRALLSISGVCSVQEAYPSFQFEDGGVRHEVAFLAPLLKRRVTDAEACDWLMRPRRSIDNRTPMEWLRADGDVDRVVRALPPPSRPAPGGDAFDETAVVGRETWSARPGRRVTGAWASRPVPH